MSEDNPKELDAQRVKEEKTASKEIRHLYTQQELSKKLKEIGNDPVREQAMRVAAAKQISRPEAKVQTDHRLQRWAGFIEQNPRSMKRLVNAYAMQQAVHFLERREVSPEALVQWTIIGLRWPILADFLSANPSAIRYFYEEVPLKDHVPGGLIPLFQDMTVKKIIAAAGVFGATALTENQIRELSTPLVE